MFRKSMGSWKSQNVPTAIHTSQLIGRASIAYSTAEGLLMDFPSRHGVLKKIVRAIPLSVIAGLLVAAGILVQPERTAASLSEKAPAAPNAAPETPESQPASAF